MKVLIKYGFIFDPAHSWATENDFEQDLARFFKEKGLSSEFVEAAPGQDQIPIVYLNKSEPFGGAAGPVKFNPPHPNKE